MNQNLTWETIIPVRSYELDFAGIVNNAVYLNYFEEARLDFLRQLNVDFYAMAEHSAAAVLSEMPAMNKCSRG